MPKKFKYRFYPETLTYYIIKLTWWQKLLKFSLFFLASIFVSVIYYFIFSSLFDLPREKVLKRENAELYAIISNLNEKIEQIEKVVDNLQERDDNLYRTIFGADPIDKNIRLGGIGGVNRYENIKNIHYKDAILSTATRLDKLMGKVYIQSKSYDELTKLAKKYSEKLRCVPAIQPISNKDLKFTASGFGYRVHPIYGIVKFHEGMDFVAPVGTEVYATGDGIVEEVESSMRGYGNKIIINHGFGYKTLYAHLNGFNVKPGQKVKRGDIIGWVGNSGLSTAPHLHYEVHYKDKKVNPINYFFEDLSPEEYDRMIQISQNFGQTFD